MRLVGRQPTIIPTVTAHFMIIGFLLSNTEWKEVFPFIITNLSIEHLHAFILIFIYNYIWEFIIFIIGDSRCAACMLRIKTCSAYTVCSKTLFVRCNLKVMESTELR